MLTLTPAERTALKALAHHLDASVSVGDAGLTAAVLREIDVALKARELVKVRVAGDDREARNILATAACEALDAALVTAIGKRLVLYRPRPPGQDAPSRTRRHAGPRRTKKQEGARAERRPRR